jgi:HSP20 family protein
MTLNRWDPFRDMLSFQEKLNRFVDSCFDESSLRPTACWSPIVDVLETPDAYIFRVELPGVGKSNISVEVAGSHLRLSGERPGDTDPPHAAYHRIERVHGVFERTFTLPGPVDADKAEAKYLDGLLEVYLPKTDRHYECSVNVVKPR